MFFCAGNSENYRHYIYLKVLGLGCFIECRVNVSN